MSDRSKIAWTDATWQVTRGCTKVSEGCRSCYAMRQAHRFSGPGKAYEELTKLTSSGPIWTGDVRLVPENLEQPLRWRKPRRVFVDSMSDLFHDAVPDDFIAAAVGIMAATPQHDYQVLTKRPDRMAKLMSWLDFEAIRGATLRIARRMIDGAWTLPLPNLWLGTSAENQATLDERLPHLLATPAALRWLSLEPLLGPIVIHSFEGLSWIVCGGESGPGARAPDIGWIRSIVEQCSAAKVPVFVKQDSGYRPGEQGRIPDDLWARKEMPR